MKPSLGLILGLPIAGIVTLILVIGGVIILANSTYGEDRAIGWGCLCVGIVVILGAGFFMWPWHMEYHEWQPKQGTITQISSRFLASDTSGGGSTQRFVVTFKEVDRGPYSCDDTRCALLHPGDYLSLSCKREWQYSGNPGWSCNFVDARQK